MGATRTLAAAVLALGGAIAACQSSAQGFYIGGAAGRSDFNNDITTGLFTSGTVDTRSTGYKVFGGYQFGEHFGVEIAYVDLGKATYSGSYYGLPVTSGKVDVWGLNLSVVGTLPLNSTFALFGKIGLFAWDASAQDVTGGVSFSESANGGDYSFGLGLRLNFTKNLSASIEWERFGLTGLYYDLGRADLLSLGMAYRF